MYIILAILFFGLLVVIHELGHFAVAKACGIRVEEFSAGFGPEIFQTQKGETKYSLRIIPFGGYCAMTGEDGESEDPRAFVNQAAWKRLLVLVAGSFMNFLLGFIIILCLYSSAAAFIAPKVETFMDGCPLNSAEALQEGDRFYAIDGHRIYIASDITDFLDRGDSRHDLTLIRDGKKLKLEGIEFVRREYEGHEGQYFGFNLGYDEATPASKLQYAWSMTKEFVRWVWMGLEQLFSGGASVNDLSGPVGIVDMMAETGAQAASTRDAIEDILYIGAFIAVNLAVMNMLPIPALDGGRVFTLLITLIIEKITRRKLDPKYESYIHAAGMIILLALMAFIMLHDIWRLIVK